MMHLSKCSQIYWSCFFLSVQKLRQDLRSFEEETGQLRTQNEALDRENLELRRKVHVKILIYAQMLRYFC